MTSPNSPITTNYAQDLRHLDKIITRERETYELVTTNISHTDSQRPSEPSPCHNAIPASRERTRRPEDTRRFPAKDVEQHSILTSAFPLSDNFLALFFDRMPQEIRDLVYGFVQRGEPWVTEPLQDFVIQAPYIFVSGARTLPAKVSPYYPVPGRLSSNPSLSSSPPPPSLLLDRLGRDIAACFFAENRFWVRYRYTDALATFLSTPFALSEVVPGERMRRLGILLGPPESAEDSYGLDDEESEYPWDALFPEPKNGKCRMWRGQLERDFQSLGEACGVGQTCEIKVYLMDVYDWEGDGVEEWLGRWAESVNERGGRVSMSRLTGHT
jgi:hypothetical protein